MAKWETVAGLAASDAGIAPNLSGKRKQLPANAALSKKGGHR
jgi:hypothetical protein